MTEYPLGYLIARRFCHRNYILILTFISYALFHASRKPISITKSVLIGNCRDGTVNFCPWAPFDSGNWPILMGCLEYGFVLTYAISLIFVGRLAEKSKLNKFLTIGMILSGFSTILFGLARQANIHSFAYFFLVQIFAGVIQASGWPAIIALISNWCGSYKAGFLLGVWNSNGALGNAIGALISSYFVEIDWSMSFIVPGMILMIYGFVAHFFLIDKPEDITHLDLTSIQSHNQSNVLGYSFILFFNKIVISTFMYWLPNFILNFYIGVTPEYAAQLSTLFDFGGIFGGIISGLISDEKLQNSSAHEEYQSKEQNHTLYKRAFTCAVMFSFAAPFLYFFYEASTSGYNKNLCNILLFMTGLFVYGPCSLVMTAVSTDLGRSQSSNAVATVSAIIDSTGSLGAAFGPFMTGLLMNYGFTMIFQFLTLCIIIACILSARIVVRLKN